MIVKNKKPDSTRNVILIAKDYYEPQVIHIVLAWYSGDEWFFTDGAGADWEDIEEYTPPYGRFVGWSEYDRREK